MAETPRLSALLESALYVCELERSRAFYVRVMGLDPFMADSRMCALGVPGQGVVLLFLKGGSASPTPTPFGTIPPHDGGGQLHLAFAIPGDSLQDWEKHLAAENVIVESRITWPLGGTSLYFRDPDQHCIELATPGLWPNYMP